MTFIATREVWVEADVSENNLANMKHGNPVEMVLDVASGEVFAGKVANAIWGVRFDNNLAGHIEGERSGTGDSVIFNTIAKLWIRILAYLSYIR